MKSIWEPVNYNKYQFIGDILLKFLSRIFELLKETYNHMWEVSIGLHGASIAFYAIFSTAPLIIILIWILSIILGNQMGQQEFQQTLQSIVGADMTRSIDEVVESASRSPSGIWSTVIAIVTLVFGATTLISQFKYTFNKIWGVKEPQLGTVWYFLWDRLMGLLFIGSLSLLFIAGLVSESILYSLEDWLIPIFGEDLIFVQIGSSLINILLAFIFFMVMYRFLPDLHIRWRDIAVGALVTTVFVIIGKSLVDWYLSSTLQPTYKAAGSFVIFLIWIYYNVQVVLVGAIFTQVFTSKYGGKVEPYWGAKLDDDW